MNKKIKKIKSKPTNLKKIKNQEMISLEKIKKLKIKQKIHKIIKYKE